MKNEKLTLKHIFDGYPDKFINEVRHNPSKIVHILFKEPLTKFENYEKIIKNIETFHTYKELGTFLGVNGSRASRLVHALENASKWKKYRIFRMEGIKC